MKMILKVLVMPFISKKSFTNIIAECPTNLYPATSFPLLFILPLPGAFAETPPLEELLLPIPSFRLISVNEVLIFDVKGCPLPSSSRQVVYACS